MGPLETQFFAYVQMRRLETVRVGEMAGVLGLSADQERDLFRRLARSGWIVRLRRGLYLVPRRLPAGGKWSPGEALILAKLMEDREGRYQICGPNAFNFYGFDNQVPNRVFAYNNRISGERTIGGLSLTLIKVSDKRLGAIESLKTPYGVCVIYSSRARTLMDAVYDWSRFNSIPRAYTWIQSSVGKDPALALELAKVTVRFGNQGTLRRIGWVLQQAEASAEAIDTIKTAIRISSSLVPLIPGRPLKGSVNRDWGLLLNENRST